MKRLIMGFDVFLADGSSVVKAADSAGGTHYRDRPYGGYLPLFGKDRGEESFSTGRRKRTIWRRRRD